GGAGAGDREGPSAAKRMALEANNNTIARRVPSSADWLAAGGCWTMSDFHGRRGFLAGLGRSGAALAAAPWLAGIGYAETRGPARAVLPGARFRSELDRPLLRGL